jgi:phage/plasmid-like protein (TIGR03299 family)
MHDLDYNRELGRHAFVSNQPAWHRLGLVLDHPMTSAEALRLSGADFPLGLTKVAAHIPGAGYTEIPGRRAVVRGDTKTVLGIVSDHYKIFPAKDCFSFLDSLLPTREIYYEVAGVLGQGRRVWMLAKLPDSIHIKGVDTVDEYLLLTNTNDGTRAAEVRFTPIRPVCANTLHAALRQKTKTSLKIRHKGDIASKLNEAREVLGLATQYYAEIGQVMEGLASVTITPHSLEDYFEKLFPDPKPKNGKLPERNVNRGIRNRLTELFEYQLEHEPKETGPTVWGAYNSVTRFLTHEAGDRTRKAAESSDQKRLESQWFGSFAKKSFEAFDLAVTMSSDERSQTTKPRAIRGS